MPATPRCGPRPRLPQFNRSGSVWAESHNGDEELRVSAAIPCVHDGVKGFAEGGSQGLSPSYEKDVYEMSFDNAGCDIAMDSDVQGVKPHKEVVNVLQGYRRGEDCWDLLDPYEPHPDGEIERALNFIRPGRVATMSATYAGFFQRLEL